MRVQRERSVEVASEIETRRPGPCGAGKKKKKRKPFYEGSVINVREGTCCFLSRVRGDAIRAVTK